MTDINNNRSQMNNQYGFNQNQFQNQYTNAGNQFQNQNSNFNNNLSNFNPNYSFTSKFNQQPQYGSNSSGQYGSGPSMPRTTSDPLNSPMGSPGNGWWNPPNHGVVDTSGAPTNYAPGSNGGPSASSSYNPNLDQNASFQDKVNNLYAKYGKSDTGAGSGITDASYWSNNALNNAGGDQQYVLGRLEKDLQGNGPDQGGGGFAPIAQMDMGFVNNWNPESRSYYKNFADTGGYSDQNLQDIRSRDLAPTVGMYANAKDQMARNLSLAGPSAGTNYNAALSRMTRDSSNQIANQNIATNAGIAQMVNQGKQFGTQGMGGLDTTQLNAQLSGNEANLGAAMQSAGIQSQQEIMGNQQRLQQLGMQLSSAGMSQQQQQMYLQALLANQGQQGQYGLGSIEAQIRAGQIPSNYQQGMGNASSMLGLLGQGMNAWNGLGGGRNSPYGGYGNPYGSSGGPGGMTTYGNDYSMIYGPGNGYNMGGGNSNGGETDWSSLPGYGTPLG